LKYSIIESYRRNEKCIHLKGVKADFMVSEKEYLLTPLGLHEITSQQRESLANIIYSSVKPNCRTTAISFW
jgi:hypothetical protein